MRELSLFTGMGGGVYGSMILGWQTVAYVEQDEYCQKVIAQRIQDGWFDNGEIYGDIAEFNRTDAARYAGQIDILTGGFPCQPFSVAGKREGTSDDRWLFDEIIKTIKTIQPRRLFFENVPGILGDRAIIQIYQSLNKIGYRCKPPLLLGSDDCGNIHKRQRVWIYADRRDQQPGDASRLESTQYSQQQESQSRNGAEQLHTTNPNGGRTIPSSEQPVQGESYISRRSNIRGREDLLDGSCSPFPYVRGMDDELPNRGKRLKAIGNGQDSIVMATAYKILSGEFK